MPAFLEESAEEGECSEEIKEMTEEEREDKITVCFGFKFTFLICITLLGKLRGTKERGEVF